MNDTEIIDQVRSGAHTKAVKLLYRYYPVVKKFVVKNSGNKQDAEDIFQDALVILFNKIKSGQFQLKASLNTYLFSICKNLWLEQLRKNKRELKVDSMPAIAIETENLISEEEHNSQKAMQAVLQLGEKCRELLQLFYYRKLSMVQIAKQLGFASEKVAKNQKYRCIEKAKEIYLANH